MNYPAARFSDSLVLSKLAKIAGKLSKTHWNLTVTGSNFQLLSINVAAGVRKPWEGNAMAEKLAASTGVAGLNFTLVVDDRHIAQFTRNDNKPSDHVVIEQGWFTNDPKGQALFVESCGVVSVEFGLTGPSGALPTGLSDELGRFVETRDQGLARLEELYTRFTQNLLEERDRNTSDLNARVIALNEETEVKRKQLEEQFAAKEAEHAKEETKLADRLKQIDDRGAKHARRALRDSITTELNKRETKFTLTEGTNSLRTPIVAILVFAALLFVAGLVHNTLIAGEVLSKTVNGFDWGLTYFTLKQLTYTAGLISVIWYGIRWNDRWFREHANEEFKAKTMQIDILRANWVVETLLEWEREEGREIPPELLTSLTHNLFRYPEERHDESGATNLASVLLGSATKARLKIGPNNELELSRAGAKKLSKELTK